MIDIEEAGLERREADRGKSDLACVEIMGLEGA